MTFGERFKSLSDALRFLEDSAPLCLLPPDEEELRKLSLRAATAFAARCLQRVLPLAARHREYLKAKHFLSECLDLATNRVTNKRSRGIYAPSGTVIKSAKETYDRPPAQAFPSTTAQRGVVIANCLWLAGDLLLKAIDVLKSNPDTRGKRIEYFTNSAGACECSVIDVLRQAKNGDSGIELTEELRFDYNELARRNLLSPGEIGQPVDASDVGPLASPLWTRRIPDWYRKSLTEVWVAEKRLPPDESISANDFVWSKQEDGWEYVPAQSLPKLHSPASDEEASPLPKDELVANKSNQRSITKYQSLVDFLNKELWWPDHSE